MGGGGRGSTDTRTRPDASLHLQEIYSELSRFGFISYLVARLALTDVGHNVAPLCGFFSRGESCEDEVEFQIFRLAAWVEFRAILSLTYPNQALYISL
jgi:hypothetical protein